MSRERARGTAAETAVVRFLRPWFPWADRVPMSGARDRGDVCTGPGGPTIEVKNTNRLDLSGAVDEAEAESRNAGSPFGVAWIKRRGTADPGRWYVTMTGATFARLLVEAGYGADAQPPRVAHVPGQLGLDEAGA